MQQQSTIGAGRQDGIAILVTTVALLLVAMIGLTSLEHTREESTSGGRSRNVTRTLHAADAGIEFARSRLSQSPPNLNSFSLAMLDGAAVESRQRDQGSPQVLTEIGVGGTTDGYALNSGSASINNRIYQANVTGTAGSAVVEVEARFAVEEPATSSY
ncbi:MAG: hypothetical protein ACR2N6_07645 [Miltoncostaeaceae bacterium]